MKKSLYLFMMFLGLALTSCEPMEDIHEEVDEAVGEPQVQGVVEYTMTEDDYKDEDEGLGLNFTSFSSVDEASLLIPDLLEMKFPMWDEGSLARVSFDLYAPINPVEYVLSDEDYATVGLDENYFTNTSQIKDFLSMEFPQAAANDYVELTYRTVAVEVEYELTDDDFEAIGDAFETIYPDPAYSAGRYDNFDRRVGNDEYWSNDMILEAINVVMENNFQGIEGQTYELSYAIYDGNPGTESMKVRYDGSSYVLFGAENFEMEYNDYSTVEAALGTKYPEPTDNAAEFGSFSIVEGSSSYWSQDMILEALNVVLNDYFPAAEEGAKYNVVYTIYNGEGTEDVTGSVVLENGTYIWNDEETISTIIETQVFAYGNGSWMIPLTLPEDIYTEEFEQRFNNFDDEDEAGFYIGRYLEPLYLYAMEGDFISVAYNYYDGDGVVTRYASFVYNEREWEFIPTVIPYTLQFGHEGSGWVVDNTITYSLSPADYSYIGEQFADVYDDPAWSVGNYNNFDVREGNRNQWTDEMLLEAMNALLNGKVAPDAEVGQKYLLTFAIYDGSAGTQQLHLIKNEDGTWTQV